MIFWHENANEISLGWLWNTVSSFFSIYKKRSLLSSSPCYLSLEKVHTMAFTIVAHAGQHGLSCRCELHSKAGQRDARVSAAASMKPQEEIIMMLSLLLKNASLLMRIMENRHLQYHVLMLDCKSSSLLETSFWMEREKTNHWSLTWDKETLIFDSRFQNWSNYWSESKTCEMNWKWIGPELDYKIGP